MENLGNRIKQLRESHKLTQKELAERLGVSAQAISKWENNVNQPDVSTVRRLCAIFEISVDEFLQENAPPANASSETNKTETAQSEKLSQRKRLWMIFSACAAAVLAFIVTFLCIFIPLSLRDNKPLSSKAIYKKVDPSVFFIEIELENGDKQGGSGFFIDDKGTAVTNYHVIQGGKSGRIVLANGKEYELESVLGKDKHSDLVVIKIDIAKSKPVKLADSLNVQTGDRVYTIGYPESFLLGVESSTFTEGIISKASYTLEGVEYIQTNADITHGNSGGVLLNDKGEVIGITTGAIQINGASYMNLALPANNILRIDKTEYVLPLDEFTEKVREYTVYFMSDDSEYDTRTVLSGEQVESIKAPSNKTGYTFTGWYTDKNATIPYDFNNEVTQDLWLYAGWKANRYTLTFAKGAENVTGAVLNITAEYGKNITLPACTYILPDYRFAGWEYDGKIYQANATVKNLSSKDGDVLTLTATWEKIKKYTLSFAKGAENATGSVANVVAEFNQTVTLPACTFTLPDYRFTGWEYNGKTYQAGEVVQNLTDKDGDVLTLTATWEKIKRYTVFFEMGNSEAQGTLPNPFVAEVGKNYVLPTPSISCKGWNLLGWQIKGTSTTYAFGASVRDLTQEDGGEVTLVAAWERKKFCIGFALGMADSDNFLQTITYGDTLTLPSASDCPRAGYTLTGWQWNGTTYPAGGEIENFYTDLPLAEFKAVWQGNTYSVKYVVIKNAETSDFVIKEAEFVYGSGYTWATEIDGFEKEGYRIASWQWKDRNKTFTAGAVASPLDENATVELYAVIKPVTFTVIILDVNGGELRSMTMQYGQDLRLEKCLGVVTDGYYYAKTGTILNADKTEYTGDPRYACAQQGGVVYLSPDYQEMKYEILLQVDWVDKNGEQHTAYLDENGNKHENGGYTYWVTLDYSQEFILPTPTIEGHAFHGWDYYKWPALDEALAVYQGGDVICKFTENVGFDVIPPVAQFVAKLTPYQYTVRYDGNGAQLGSMSNGSGTYGTAFTFANNAYIKSGCTFGGWLCGDTLYFKDDTPYFIPAYDGEIIVLKARWISYEGAGTQENPYLISTYEDLFNLSVFMKEQPAFRSAHYLMTADIDCQGKILYSIDAYTKNKFTDGEFTGVFDGGGHVIKNAVFAYTEGSGCKGLFGDTLGATIKNLGVVDYAMEQTASSTRSTSAPLVAVMYGGTIENCYTYGNFSAPIGAYMGGMIGYMSGGTVKNCKASGTLSVHYDIITANSSEFYIGGFVGSTSGTFEHCYTDMDISITVGNYQQIPRIYLGGFAGNATSNADFNQCITTGNINAPTSFFEPASDGATFHGKFSGGLRWADSSFTGCDTCYTSADAVYTVDFIHNENVAAKPNTELKSLSWLKENLGFDDTLWTEKDGALLLKAFMRE